MQHLELEEQIPAPPGAVWAVVTDHRGWARWSGFREAVLRQEGHPPPDGLGATRVLRGGGIAIEEEVTAFDPPRRLEYRLVAGAPIRDHRGEVTLEPSGAGTRLRWRVRFRPLVPGTGWLIRRLLARHLRGILARLAACSFPAQEGAGAGSGS